MQPTPNQVEARISSFQVASFPFNFVKGKTIKNIQIEANHIVLDMVLGFPFKTKAEEWKKALVAHITQAFPGYSTQVHLTSEIETHVGQGAIKALPHIKNIIAVASGKGGVGKSTVSVNLALALAQEGASVGLLDADIYGPSQPHMLGLSGRPEIKDKTIIPMQKHGLQVMSMGFLVEENAAIVWRGPMIAMALQQLLNDTQWGYLDYLIVDLPPGTGDIQLTLSQKIPVSGVVIVTTPQEVALQDVRRAAAMFQKLNVPLLGVVENMAVHICSHCGYPDALFGQGGGQLLAQEFKTPLLAQFPLDRKLGVEVDSGTPTVVKDSSSPYAEQYRALGRLITAELSLHSKTYSHKFPPIKVES